MTKIIETGILLIIILMAGCGGGGDGSAPVNTLPSNVGAGRVSIADPTYDGKSASATISGEAFISPTWWGCSPYGCVSGVTVTSQNLATGFISTVQPKMSCILNLCDNTWSSTLPLAVGSNNISVSASDPSGNIGYASCTLVRSN